ncbi:VanZ family protein [Paenibacillus sp. 481]|uniref:VanZ family protein n=1 Tax=Paenibacillus sp. 481 TaxID=2835869 RepID=UPI001E52BEB8|nr:VanZ family protein [Paenibacillus sp. 481]UHA74643.1 VanZ family protein [Paenibacillus sp. 481]
MYQVSNRWLRRLLVSSFFIYLAIIAKLLLFREGASVLLDYEQWLWNDFSHIRSNLTPFRTIERYILVQKQFAYKNLYGNLLLFFPFGVCLPLLWKCWNRFIVFALFLLSIIIGVEFIQGLSQIGVFDIDDIILNSIGGLCGFMLGKWLANKLGLHSSSTPVSMHSSQ